MTDRNESPTHTPGEVLPEGWYSRQEIERIVREEVGRGLQGYDSQLDTLCRMALAALSTRSVAQSPEREAVKAVRCAECGYGKGWLLGFPKRQPCGTCNPNASASVENFEPSAQAGQKRKTEEG